LKVPLPKHAKPTDFNEGFRAKSDALLAELI
jgi:hypothetical protein